jgi:hypothetical protein
MENYQLPLQSMENDVIFWYARKSMWLAFPGRAFLQSSIFLYAPIAGNISENFICVMMSGIMMRNFVAEMGLV